MLRRFIYADADAAALIRRRAAFDMLMPLRHAMLMPAADITPLRQI